MTGSLQYSDGGHPYHHHIDLSFRDVTDAMPDRVSPLHLIVISPSGKPAFAWVAVPRGLKTIHNAGQQMTYPRDFLTAHGNQPALHRGIYTMLVESLTGEQIACGGFIDWHDPLAGR